MIKQWPIVLAALALAPAAARAQSPFDGKWKVDIASAQLPSKPQVYLLQDGVFSCKTCVPAYEVKADGMAHAVSGSPYYDHMTVKVLNARTLAIMRTEKGATVSRVKDTVSPDGGTLTSSYEDLTVPSSPVTGEDTSMRVGAAPSGASPISGSWREQKMDTLSSNAMITDISVVDGAVHLSTPAGQSYVARIDGPAAPYKGDPGTTAVAVKGQGPRTLVETDYRDGKVIDVETMTVSPDGRTLTVQVEDKLHGTTAQYTATKV